VLYPFLFQPIFKERIWGGRSLEKLYGKKLPPGVPIGESWEISDRPGDESVITNGPLAGKNLRWLMENHPRELLGDATPSPQNRFPLLCKILDAREKLSLQVHPPSKKAAELKGEPKTEMWYIADAEFSADLFVGLKYGVTRAQFETKIQSGTVAQCFHRVPVKAGDTMFLPSGRVHAIGAGLVIFEIQQNSDTTYRVFDWNRVGLDGKPRELHVPQSLASIDFNDFEPGPVVPKITKGPNFTQKDLVKSEFFTVNWFQTPTVEHIRLGPNPPMTIYAALTKSLTILSGEHTVTIAPGQFCLVPFSAPKIELKTEADTSCLWITAGSIRNPQGGMFGPFHRT